MIFEQVAIKLVSAGSALRLDRRQPICVRELRQRETALSRTPTINLRQFLGNEVVQIIRRSVVVIHAGQQLFNLPTSRLAVGADLILVVTEMTIPRDFCEVCPAASLNYAGRARETPRFILR